jgi:hypothetical protein
LSNQSTIIQAQTFRPETDGTGNDTVGKFSRTSLRLFTQDIISSNFCQHPVIYKRVYPDNINLLVAWVKSAKSGLLAMRLISLPDQIWIAESFNQAISIAFSSEKV